MKNIFNIFHSKRETKINPVDDILANHNLNYSELDFNSIEIDTINAYERFNKALNLTEKSEFNNLLPSFNWKPILKPLYTAILTSILIVAILYFNRETEEEKFAEVIVEKGEKIKLNVDDNMIVWLNSESSIRIPMNGKVGKKIYLQGEAYIKVSNTNKSNYSVITGQTISTIRNGAFYIKSSVSQVIATVSEGEIDFYNTKLPKSTNLTLHKDEKATLYNELDFIAVETENNTNYLFWHTGELKFENMPLNEVAKALTEYFEIPVHVENVELKNIHFSASFTNPEIDDILDKIQSTINCQIAGDGSKLIIN